MDFEKISSFTMDRSSSSIDKDNKRNDIPLWLHLKNEQFQELFRKIVSSISTTTTTLSIEELQQSAMTMYQERKRLHEKQLWLTLLKTIENDGLHRWPTLLKQVILSMNIVRNQSIEYFTDEMYSNVVRIYLQKPIIEQIVQHETMVETILEKYIEDHFHLFDYNYDHDDEQLAYEIQQQLNQNSNQIQLIQRLVSRKHELELWREEIQHLKNYLKENQWPSSFRYIHVGIPSFIETITDPTIRQQLIDQHRQILHDYKHQLLRLLLTMSEEICAKIQTTFNGDMSLFWNYQHSLSIQEKISEPILNLIDQRFSIMIRKVHAIYCYYYH